MNAVGNSAPTALSVSTHSDCFRVCAAGELSDASFCSVSVSPVKAVLTCSRFIPLTRHEFAAAVTCRAWGPCSRCLSIAGILAAHLTAPWFLVASSSLPQTPLTTDGNSMCLALVLRPDGIFQSSQESDTR